MGVALRSAWALLLGFGFIMLGGGLQGSLLAVRAGDEGFSTFITGILMSGYYVGFLGGSTLTPKILGRVGHIRVFAALASLASTSVLLHHTIVDPTAWFILRCVSGFCYAGLYVVTESWLNDTATNETRGQLLAAYGIVSMLGSAIGQLLLNLADATEFHLFVIISVLVSLGLIPITLSVARVPDFEAPESVSIKKMYDVSPLAVVGMIGAGASTGALLTLVAVYGQVANFTVSEIAYLVMSAYVGGMLLQGPIGKVSDMLDRRVVIVVLSFLTAAVCLPSVIGMEGKMVAFAMVALVGGLSFPMYALSLAHANDHLSDKERVGASSTLVMIFGIGAALGPFPASYLMDVVGNSMLFVFLAVINGFVGIFALWRMTRRASVPLEEQAPITPLGVRATSVAVEMYEEEMAAALEEQQAEAEAEAETAKDEKSDEQSEAAKV